MLERALSAPAIPAEHLKKPRLIHKSIEISRPLKSCLSGHFKDDSSINSKSYKKTHNNRESDVLSTQRIIKMKEKESVLVKWESGQ